MIYPVHLCSFLQATYIYEGYYFEFHRVCGYCPLDKRTGDPRLTMPAGFWKMIGIFQDLANKKDYETNYLDGITKLTNE